MRHLNIILNTVAGIVIISGISSCVGEAAVPEFMSGLEVTGKVYDYDLPDDPGVKDVMVVLSSYETEDKGFKFPIDRDTAYSDASGSFRIKAVAMSEGWVFRLSVADAVKERPGGQYRLAPAFDPVLHIEFNRNTFDEDTGVYRMGNIAVPVTRE